MVSATPRSRLARARSATGLMLGLPLAAGVLALAACLPVSVGDPETSEADPALTGAWLWEQGYDKRQMYVVHRYDPRTYLVQWFQYRMQFGRVEPQQSGQYKAWLTALGGERFITLEPLSARKLALPEGQGPLRGNIEYVVGRIQLTQDGETLKVRALDPNSDLLTSVHSRGEAERIIRENVQDAALYAGDEPIELRQLGEDDTEEIQSVLEAFHAG